MGAAVLGFEKKLAALTGPLMSAGRRPDRAWYINRAGQTMAVFNGPIDARTGSPPDEPERDSSDEPLLTRKINRDFAISTKEVTCREYYKFMPKFRHRTKLQLEYALRLVVRSFF